MGQMDQAAKDFEAQLDSLDNRIDRVRSLYEQYFQGIERLEPHIEREAIKHLLLDLKTNPVRSTSLRFRLNQMLAKFNTYENYWNRITRQMEEGTYQKDLFKARYHAKQRGDKEPEALEKEAAREKEPAGKGKEAPRKGGEAVPGLTNDHVRAIYDAYTTAKKRCKESIQGITPEALAATLRKQIPNIIKQYNCKAVEFKVVIKEGKAILKAVPKF